MGLICEGEFLGVERETVSPKPGQTFSAFERVEVAVLDGIEAMRLRLGRNVDPAPFLQVQPRTPVRVYCTLFNGALYASRVEVVGKPERAAS